MTSGDLLGAELGYEPVAGATSAEVALKTGLALKIAAAVAVGAKARVEMVAFALDFDLHQ